MFIAAVIGPSGSGKTTLLERLVPRLKSRGLRVAVVKHSHHPNVEVDRPGRDSARFAAAGADAVLLVAPGRLLHVEAVSTPVSFDDVARRVAGHDVLLVESWKEARLPCLEIIGPDGARLPPDVGGERLAIVSDEPTGDPLPRFARDDVDGVAAFLLARIAR